MVLLKYMLNSDFFVNYSLTIVGIVLFLYQSIQLLDQYLNATTIVSISFGRQMNETIPAITICYPCYLSIEKATQLNQNLSSENYLPLYESSTRFKSILEMFDELSLPFNYSINDYRNGSIEILSAIDVQLYGFVTSSQPIDSLDDVKQVTLSDKYPVESLTFLINNPEYECYPKCFTLFSSLRAKWKNYRSNIQFLALKIETMATLNPAAKGRQPPGYFDDIYFTIHSPNTMPMLEFNLFTQLNIKQYHIFSYSKVEARLNKDVQAMCVDYGESSNKQGEFAMYSDCLTDCMIKSLQTYCRIDCIPESTLLLRKELFVGRNDKFCRNLHNSSVNECLKDFFLPTKVKLKT